MKNCSHCGKETSKKDLNFIFKLDLSTIEVCNECFNTHLEKLDDEKYNKNSYIMGQTWK